MKFQNGKLYTLYAGLIEKRIIQNPLRDVATRKKKPAKDNKK